VISGVQSAACDAPLVAGWYGKMPCLGDFASRRLAPDFVDLWDGWLQRSIATSRQQLGDTWLDTFLTSPMWRFALTPGLCGREAYVGVLVPSVDKVGRYFPLTFAVGLDPRASLTRAMRAESWFARLENTALSALNAEFSIDALERLLAACPLQDGLTREPSGAHEFSARWREADTPQVFHLSSAQALPEALESAAYHLLEHAAAGLSFWWCVAPETDSCEFHVSPALPPPEHFATFLRSSRSG
jgi:type VI secretion system protein ImpM